MTIEDARTVLELMLTTDHTTLCETEKDAIKTVLFSGKEMRTNDQDSDCNSMHEHGLH